MKLLFDQNLSFRLVENLRDLFPGSRHVSSINLADAPDIEVWQHAAHDGFTVVSKDRDFAALSVRLGSPPQVIWIGAGNCSTQRIEALIRASAVRLLNSHEGGAPALITLR